MSTEQASAIGEDYAAEWKDMLAHLKYLVDHHKVFEAMQYISTSLFNLLGNFTEDYRMASLAKTENILSRLQRDRDTIEGAFDGEKTATTAAEQEALAAKAKAAMKDIKDTLKKYEITSGNPGGLFSKDFVNSVIDQLNTATTPPSGMTLGAWWHSMWMPEIVPLPTTSGDDPTPGGPTNNPSIQIVTNALTAVSSDFSSQSSIVQSKLKYEEANDEQYKAIMHSAMSNYINQEKSSNNAMQSAGS